MSDPWNREEVEAIVADYFHMLAMELAGQSFSKSAHRRQLAPRLANRSERSIERKHQNISAILIELNCPYISGYKPLQNYQALLFEVVANRVQCDKEFDRLALEAVERPAVAPLLQQDALVLEKPPAVRQPREMDDPAPFKRRERGIVRDYLAREAHNRSLGEAGEQLVLEYERRRLRALGCPQLSEKVEHVSRTKGDGLGYDILSYDISGRERLIEVKTTSFGNLTPFYISEVELKLSKHSPNLFHLYRVFDFRTRPRMYALSGNIEINCRLKPVSYLARLG